MNTGRKGGDKMYIFYILYFDSENARIEICYFKSSHDKLYIRPDIGRNEIQI